MTFSEMKIQLIAELKSDKRKTAILSIALVVALVLSIRLASKFSGNSSPIKASASTSETNTKLMSPSQRLSGRAGDLRERRIEYLNQLDRNIERDLFEPNLLLFPPPAAAEEIHAAAPLAQTPTTAPAITAEEIRQRYVREQANALELQTVMVSETPTAIVNGRVVRAGDFVSGFVISEITPQSVLVEKDGVKIRLEIRK